MGTSLMDERKKELRKIANENGIDIDFDNSFDNTIPFNQAASYGEFICMNTYNNVDNLTAAFFHELAHCKFDAIREKAELPVSGFACMLSNESMCWELGFSLAAKYGYTWKYDHPVYVYAYRCLFTYVFGDSDDYLRQDMPIKRIRRDIENWAIRCRRVVKKDT